MSGTKDGGNKTKKKVLEKDPDFYKKIGSKGGKVKRPETRYFSILAKVRKND